MSRRQFLTALIWSFMRVTKGSAFCQPVFFVLITHQFRHVALTFPLLSWYAWHKAWLVKRSHSSTSYEAAEWCSVYYPSWKTQNSRFGDSLWRCWLVTPTWDASSRCISMHVWWLHQHSWIHCKSHQRLRVITHPNTDYDMEMHQWLKGDNETLFTNPLNGNTYLIFKKSRPYSNEFIMESQSRSASA